MYKIKVTVIKPIIVFKKNIFRRYYVFIFKFKKPLPSSTS